MFQASSYQEPPSPRRILQFLSSFLVVLLRRSGVPPLAYSSLYLLGGTLHSSDYLGQTTSPKKSGEPGFFSFHASNVSPKTFRPGEGPNRHLSFFCFVSCFCPRLCSSASALLLLLLCLCLCLLLLLVLPLPLLLLLSLHLLLLPLLLLRTVSVAPQGKTTYIFFSALARKPASDRFALRSCTRWCTCTSRWSTRQA